MDIANESINDGQDVVNDNSSENEEDEEKNELNGNITGEEEEDDDEEDDEEMETSENQWKGKVNEGFQNQGPPPGFPGRGPGPSGGNPFGTSDRITASRGDNRENRENTGAPARPAAQNWQNQSGNDGGQQQELWIETKTDEGKSYFYHAQTRETTWNKPEGGNVRVMTQAELEEMNRRQQHQATPNSAVGKSDVAENGGTFTKQSMAISAAPIKGEMVTSQPPPNMLSQPPPTQQPLTQPPPNIAGVGVQPLTQQPPPALHQQPPPFFQPGMHPPNFAQPPFGMPPPGYGGYPSGPPGWGMPWNQHMHMPPSAASQDKPAKNLIIKPGVIDPAVIARAAEWSEHRAPDGRPYYYHAARGESVWEKPQALRDMEAARMAAHSGATPQQAIPPPTATMPHLMPNPLMHLPPTGGYVDPAAAYNAAASANMKPAAMIEPSKAAQAAALEKEAKAKAAEEKRKKDEEQKKATAASNSTTKPVDKSRPISSTPIAGTPWCVVWTGDARVFFYNPSTRTSVWERPEELLDREDVDKAVSTPPDQLKSVVPTSNEKDATKENEKVKTETAAVVEEGEREDDEVIKIRTESESSVEEVPAKKSKISTKLSKKSDANEAAVEAEVRAAKERALVPLETRIKQFKEMLREKDVSAFSTWEKELHKIVFDPRYLLLTSKERKQVFEKYVKDRAEEERKEKRNKMRQKRDDFRMLMEDAKLHGKSSFSEFCQRFGKDERYRGIEKIRERESLFNEYIVDVRRREKEEKFQKKEQIRKDFIEMLRERADIDRHTRWHDIKKKFDSDSRYRAVENSMYREEYFQDYVRQVKDEKRKQREQKERERERDRERERKSDRKSDRRDRERRSSRDRDYDDKDGKSKEKDRDKDKDKEKEKEKEKDNKERERDRDKEKDRERNGNKKKREDSDEGEHHDDDDEEQVNSEADADMEVTSENDEAERLQKERDRQMRAEQSIREREKEVQRTLAGHMRDRDKEREHHKRDEAIGHFNALLTDLVRNPDFTWKEVKRQLRKDHRWDLIESLDRDHREKLFNEHIDALMKKKREKFREMLEEIITLELTSSWKDIKKLIKEDPRYQKYNNSDKCEREFRDYIKDKTLQAKAALRELLQECKLITHKSIEIVKDNPNHLKEIQDILKNDKRYLVLEHLTDERTTIVVNYLEELNKRGPPPPPTASESTRRNK